MRYNTSDGEDYPIYGNYISKDYWADLMMSIPDTELIREVKRRGIVGGR